MQQNLINPAKSRTSLNPDYKCSLQCFIHCSRNEEITAHRDHLRHLRVMTKKKISSKSAQMKTVSSNPTLREVLLLQQIQDHPGHCLHD
jgi:hypothetical protein